MKQKQNLDMGFHEVLARLAQTPKAAIDKVEKEQVKAPRKAKVAKQSKPPKG